MPETESEPRPSQADIIAENEQLRAALAARPEVGEAPALLRRAETAEALVTELQAELAEFRASNPQSAAQVSTLTKQVGELTAQLTAANGEIAILRPRAEDAGKQAAEIVASCRIVGNRAASPNPNGEKPRQSLTQMCREANSARPRA